MFCSCFFPSKQQELDIVSTNFCQFIQLSKNFVIYTYFIYNPNILLTFLFCFPLRYTIFALSMNLTVIILLNYCIIPSTSNYLSLHLTFQFPYMYMKYSMLFMLYFSFLSVFFSLLYSSFHVCVTLFKILCKRKGNTEYIYV